MFSEALVTPRSTGTAVAGSPPSAKTLAFASSYSKRSMYSPGSIAVSPGAVDDHLAHHLAHDDLDVLVVDVHALVAVDLLDFLDQVELHGLRALDAQDVLRVQRAVGELLAGVNVLAGLDAHAGGRRDRRTRALRAPRRGSRCGWRVSMVTRPGRRAMTWATGVSFASLPLPSMPRPSGRGRCRTRRAGLRRRGARRLPAGRSGRCTARWRRRGCGGRSPSRVISTTPSISEMIALSFGTRASNSSVTRGRPVVISPPAT